MAKSKLREEPNLNVAKQLEGWHGGAHGPADWSQQVHDLLLKGEVPVA